MSTTKIIYTRTEEAPAQATCSFLPMVKASTDAAGIEVETRDLSLAGQTLGSFPEQLTAGQNVSDAAEADARRDHRFDPVSFLID